MGFCEWIQINIGRFFIYYIINKNPPYSRKGKVLFMGFCEWIQINIGRFFIYIINKNPPPTAEQVCSDRRGDFLNGGYPFRM